METWQVSPHIRPVLISRLHGVDENGDWFSGMADLNYACWYVINANLRTPWFLLRRIISIPTDLEPQGVKTHGMRR